MKKGQKILKKKSRSMLHLTVLLFAISIFLGATVASSAEVDFSSFIDNALQTSGGAANVSGSTTGGSLTQRSMDAVAGEKEIPKELLDKTEKLAAEGKTGVLTYGVGVGRSPEEAIANMKANSRSLAFGTSVVVQGEAAKTTSEGGIGTGGRLRGGDDSKKTDLDKEMQQIKDFLGTIPTNSDASGSDATQSLATFIDNIMNKSQENQSKGGLLGAIAAMLGAMGAVAKKSLGSKEGSQEQGNQAQPTNNEGNKAADTGTVDRSSSTGGDTFKINPDGASSSTTLPPSALGDRAAAESTDQKPEDKPKTEEQAKTDDKAKAEDTLKADQEGILKMFTEIIKMLFGLDGKSGK